MKRIITAFVALAMFGGANSVMAQEGAATEAPAETAGNLDQLLEQVRRGKLREERLHREREAQFISQKNNQARLKREAEQTKANEERRSERLEAEFERNKTELVRLDTRLRERLGNLSELFGVLQQVAGDARGNFSGSIISTQYPDRTAALDTLIDKASAASDLPSIEEMENLWFEMHREMTESGKVVRFPYQVRTPDGLPQEVDLIRVGAFNLVSDGKYYNYSFSDDTAKVEELGRQPSGRFTGTIDDLEDADAGEMVSFAIDPSRGQILSVLVRVPGIVDRWHQGGIVGYIISGLGVIGVLLVIERWVYLSGQNRKVRRQIREGTPSTQNPLGRVLQVYADNRSVDVETLELKLDEAILKETPALERSLVLIKIISAVAPLFGLLGTVTGMIVTFQAIVLFGTGDPTVMANGISQALVTTVLGLVVAIPTLLLHSIVAGQSKGIIHILEEQSAGIIAVHAEKEGSHA